MSKMNDRETLAMVPLFPLPNVVLLPNAILPLHIFEPRYREMMVDSLGGSRLIAMALLAEGWQLNYHAAPAIHPVVCVGRILTHEKLPDGRYNLLLQGVMRARVVEEDRTLGYRRAALARIHSTVVGEFELADERQHLTDTTFRSRITNTTLGRELSKLLDSPLGTEEVADIFAFNLIDDLELKQQLLEEPDVKTRVRRIVASIRQAHPLQAAFQSKPRSVDLN